MPKLPNKKEGDLLSAGHVNFLTRAAEMVLGPDHGGFVNSQGGAISGLPPHQQRVGIITDTTDAPIYEFRLRYFDPDDDTDTADGSWVTDEDSGPYYVDGNALGGTFSADQKLIVWWDAQRSLWVPGGTGGGGGDTQILSFLIVSSDPTTRSALAEIRTKAFEGEAYGSILNDTVVNVYDLNGCWLNEPNVDLTGRYGDAVLTYITQEAADLFFSGYAPAKYWRVIGLCCAEPECEPIG